jgi:signal transduction histidine kinase
VNGAAAPPAFGILTTRIGRRFLGLFAGCALLPLAVFAWLAVTRTTDQMRREIVGALHNGAKTAGMGIAARLSQIAGDLALARDVARQPGEGAADAPAVAALRQHVGMRCAAVWVVDGASTRLLCGDRAVDLGPRKDSERARLAADKPVVRALGQPLQLVMYRALDASEPDGALVAASIRGDRFWDAEELQAPGCEFGAFDSMWRPLFHTFPANPDTQPLALAAVSAGSSGTVEWTPAGTPHLARYWRAFLLPQYDFDLYVVQSRSQDEALAVSDQFTWWFAATAIGTLLLVVFVSLVQLRRTLDPIATLRNATRRVASGDMDARVAIRAKDEFGDLGTAFNDMAAQLQENVRKREQTERELVASRDAALAAATAKAEFVSNVSHELRTPMTEILSAVEIVNGLGDADSPSREEFSRIALRGAQRLARLIDDVLELGTTDVWTMGPVDIAASVACAVRALPADERARVRLDAADGLPWVVGNDQRLDETWGRLLDNAVKFSARGAPIDVRVRADGRDVVVEVVDRGVGIAQADVQRLFEPFCQLGRDQLTDKARGTGLGLTLAKSAVDRHGGRIEVESELGVGSTFRVVLPAHAELPAARV